MVPVENMPKILEKTSLETLKKDEDPKRPGVVDIAEAMEGDETRVINEALEQMAPIAKELAMPVPGGLSAGDWNVVLQRRAALRSKFSFLSGVASGACQVARSRRLVSFEDYCRAGETIRALTKAAG